MKTLKILALMFAGLCMMSSCSDDDKEEKTASEAEKIAGAYNGTNEVVVAASPSSKETYTADIEYKITANKNNTINVVVPTYSLDNTVMGNLTLGTHVISNIPYDAASGSFTKVYGTDGLTMQFKAVRVNNGVEIPVFDKAYSFTDNSTITVKKTNEGLKVANSFQLGSMPFPIVANFTSSIK